MSTNQPSFHYKSHLTKQKQHEYKSRSIDHFDLDNIEGFEKQFIKFQSSFQQKYFPETTTSSSEQVDHNSKLQRKKTIIQRFASQNSLITNANNINSNSNLNAPQGILKNDIHPHNKNAKVQTLCFDDSQCNTQTITTSNLKKDQPFNGLIDQKFRLMLKQNAQKENSVVNYFGNSLIAAVFQSLIIKTLEDKFHIKINMDCDIPISTNVLKIFELSTVVINNIKEMDKKKEYIYSTMCKKVDSLLSVFDDKVKMREALIEKQEKEDKKKIKQTSTDQFSWLKLKASQDTLRKKLRQQIVEKLSEYENLIIIESDIKRKQELKEEGNLDESNKIQSNLNNFKFTSSKEVFNNMSTYGSHKIQQYLSRLGITKYPDEKNPTSKINKTEHKRCKSQEKIQASYYLHSSTSHKRMQSGSINRIGFQGSLHNSSQFLLSNSKGINELQQDNSLSQNKMGIKGFKDEEVDDNKFWTQDRENEFQKQRSEKKYIYSNEVVASNWNDVGFLPFVQRYILQYKKSIHRDTLLNRYSDGEVLTEEELKFLANTSELLNSCVDKQFMQKAVNIVNPDLLENVIDLLLLSQFITLLIKYIIYSLCQENHYQQLIKLIHLLFHLIQGIIGGQGALYMFFYLRLPFLQNYLGRGGYLKIESLQYINCINHQMRKIQMPEWQQIRKEQLLKQKIILQKQMELGLAEQILNNYEDAKLQIKRARQSFLKEKQEKQQEWLQDQYDKAARQRQKINNANFYRRYYKMFSGILERMEKEKKFADKLPDNIYGAEFLNDYLLGKASEKESIQKIYKIGQLNEYEFKQYLENKKRQMEEKHDQNNELQRFKKLSKPTSFTSDDFIKNIKRRQQHPSSKIFIEKHNPESEEEINKDLTIEQQEQIRYNKERKQQIKQIEIQKYELNLKTIDILKDKQNFKTFYSGGPAKQQQQQMSIYERYRRTGKNNATAQEMNSIYIIQKRIRAFLKRKELTQQMRNIKIKKDYKYKHIIDQIQMNPNTIHLKIKDSFNPTKPSIDDIQLLISKKKHSDPVRASFQRIMSRSNSCYSINRSFSHISHMQKKTPSFNCGSIQPSQQNELKCNEIQSPLNENRTPLNRTNSKLIQLNQGANPYLSSHAKMQEEMAERHRQFISQTATPQNFSTFNNTPKTLDAKSTQQSTAKKDLPSNYQFRHLAHQQKNAKNHTLDIASSKQSIQSDEQNSNESVDKFDATLLTNNNNNNNNNDNIPQSPLKKINQQTYNNNMYQQKRTSLLFKIPSSAVKINKYIDTKNTSQQFALKEFLLPKTPKENLLMNSKKLQEKTGTKIAEAFGQRQKTGSIHIEKSSQINSTQNITQPSTQNMSQPSNQISQFVFQSPSSLSHLKKTASQNNLQINQTHNKSTIGSNILASSPRSGQHSNDNDNEDYDFDQSDLQEENNHKILDVCIPDIKSLEPPENIPKLTIKQQRLLASAGSNKLQLLQNSGFIFYEHDVNARDNYGNTAMHIAAKNNNFEILNWLITKKANPNLKNKNGWTPLHFAFSQNKIDGIMILTNAGGDLNILNKKGETPLALASQNILQMLGFQKGITVVTREDESMQCGYLKSFNNNILLRKRDQINEFVPSSAQFQMYKQSSHSLNVVNNKLINSFQ